MQEIIQDGLRRLAEINPSTTPLTNCHVQFARILKTLPDSGTKLDFMRGYIDLLVQHDGDYVDGLFGIKKIEENRDSRISCFSYVFGPDVNLMEHAREMRFKWRISKPVPGAYALYSDQLGYATHVGRVVEDEMVVSKWGPHLPVYQHPVMMVPLCYGPSVVFRQPPA